MFFVSYLVCEVPANMLLTRVRPSLFLPGLGVLWGIFAMLQGATRNWTQLVGLRFLIGVAEVSRRTRAKPSPSVQYAYLTNQQAGFAPGCAFYLSAWYRRYELTTRYSILYTSVPLAGAVSGLIAGVITQYMEGVGGLRGWRWLFVRFHSCLFLSCKPN